MPSFPGGAMPRIHRPRGLVLLFVALSLAACESSQGAQPSASGPPQIDPKACAGKPAAQSYPGWPGGSTDVIPVPVSSQLAVGQNRFLLTLVDGSNKLLAKPEVTVDLAFYDLNTDPSKAVAQTTGTYMDSGNGSGLYRASVEFTCSGDWGVAVTAHRPGSADSTARVVFPVHAVFTTPAVGSQAPAVETPTARDAAGIAAISTDPHPDPDYYRLTIAQAVTQGKPALIVFATPAFCQTRTCGPTLDLIKKAAAPYKDRVNMVHVEPYILQKTVGGLQPLLDASGQLQTVPAVDAYGLIREPYTFVIDAQGKVSAGFEGIVAAEELTAALDAVTKPGS